MDIGFGDTIDEVPRGSIVSTGIEDAAFANPDYERLLNVSNDTRQDIISRASAPYKKQRETTNFSDRQSVNCDTNLNTSNRSARSSIAPGMISGNNLTPNTAQVDQKIFQMITENLFSKLELFLKDQRSDVDVVNISEQRGYTALAFAAFKNHTTCFKAILNHGIKYNIN